MKGIQWQWSNPRNHTGRPHLQKTRNTYVTIVTIIWRVGEVALSVTVHIIKEATELIAAIHKEKHLFEKKDNNKMCLWSHILGVIYSQGHKFVKVTSSSMFMSLESL